MSELVAIFSLVRYLMVVAMHVDVVSLSFLIRLSLKGSIGLSL